MVENRMISEFKGHIEVFVYPYLSKLFLLIFILAIFLLYPAIFTVCLFIMVDIMASYFLKEKGILFPIDLSLIGVIICGYFFGSWTSFIIALYIIPKKLFSPPMEIYHIIKMPFFFLIGYLASLNLNFYIGAYLIIMRYIYEFLISLFFRFLDGKRAVNMIYHCVSNIFAFSLLYNLFMFFR